MVASYTDFYTGDAAEAGSPQLVASSVVDGSVGIAPNASLRFVFDQPLSATSLEGGSVEVRVGGQLVAGEVSLSSDRMVLTFTPSGSLPSGSDVEVTVSGFVGVSGAEMAQATSSFSTLGSYDLLRSPGVAAAATSQNGSRGPSSAIDGNDGSYWQTAYRQTPAYGVETYAEYELPGSATVSGLTAYDPISASYAESFIVKLYDALGAELYESPLQSLGSDGRVSLSFAEVAGVSKVRVQLIENDPNYARLASFSLLGFYEDANVPAGDFDAPRVFSMSPAPRTGGVEVTSPIVLTFGEGEVLDPTTVSSSTVRVRLDNSSNNVVAGSYEVAGNRITFTPLTTLPSNRRVYVRVETNGVRDVSGQGTAFFQDYFDTGADGADEEAPRVVMMTPASGTEASPQSPVVLTFSESLNAATINTNAVTMIVDGVRRNPSISRSADNRTLTLSTSLPASSQVTVVVTSDVQDLAGNGAAPFQASYMTGEALDTTRPRITVQRPSSGASGVPGATAVTLYADDALAASSIGEALFLAQDGTLIPGSFRLEGEGQALVAVPDEPFASDGSLVQVWVTSDATDEAGNQLYDHAGSFRTEDTSSDGSRAPTIQRSSPNFYTSQNPLSTVFLVEFSEPLDPASVSADTVDLTAPSGAKIAGQVSLEKGGRVIRFVPDEPLTGVQGTYAYLNFRSGIADLDGQAFSPASYYYYFVQPDLGAGETGLDEMAPMLTAQFPPQGAEGVGINAEVTLDFSETVAAITADAGTIALRRASDGQLYEGSFRFSSSDRRVVFTPFAPLPPETEFEVAISGIEDRSGNSLSETVSAFTTGRTPDFQGPSRVSSTPDNNNTDVPVNAYVQVSFDEPIAEASVTDQSVRLYDRTGGVFVEGEASLSADGLTVSFVPDEPLAVNRDYDTYISYYASLTDLTGNAGGYNWIYPRFTTGLEEDETSPEVLLTSPVAGQTDVPTNARIRVRFSEPIEPASLDAITLADSQGNTVEVTKTLTDARTQATLTPKTLLQQNEGYDVRVA
ncbi:Ig-like domain-containing protein, partial [Parvularcula maris]